LISVFLDDNSSTQKSIVRNATFTQVIMPSEKLTWDKRAKTAFVVKNIYSETNDKEFEALINHLIDEYSMTVIIEESMQEKFQFEKTIAYENSMCEVIDIIIAFGGDGTILHTLGMIPSDRPVPPILGFNTGSIGFLTPFCVTKWKETVTEVFAGKMCTSVRMRLNCMIKRSNGDSECNVHVLNEAVVDRGPSPFLCNLDCYCNGVHMTTVQADGLIVSTPTGSTAYSMSAGGSICHPHVRCVLLTPICPHTLSFRPIILPDDDELVIKVPEDSRASSWVSFDGRSRQELHRGDSIEVKSSPYPAPMICERAATKDWFEDLSDIFLWNRRKRQKAFSNGGRNEGEAKKEV
jgi:NAD+ kinase